MAVRVKVPRLSENTDEVTVTAWFVHEGERIEKGCPLVELTTDKAAFEVVAPATGHLLRIYAKVKSIVPTGFVLGLIGHPDEEAPAQDPSNAKRLGGEKRSRRPLIQGLPSLQPHAASGSEMPKGVRATPAARRLARELGIDLAEVARHARAEIVTESMVREWKRGR